MPPEQQMLIVAPGTLSYKSVTLLWDNGKTDAVSYKILLNGKNNMSSEKTNATVEHLLPGTEYTLQVEGVDKTDKTVLLSNKIKLKTPAKRKLYSITDFGARGDGKILNTRSIQNAIDACEPGGTVYIPAGNFMSGALFLKSNMTLYIAKGATLIGSPQAADYEPFINNRFEGWEMKTFASLLNAGTMDRKGGYNVSNLSVKGEGTIRGGGARLAKAMIGSSGMRSRGRLICLLNCNNVNLEGLTMEESPCWTIHYIYSKDITCQGLKINSQVENGDGIDPDSSTDSYIFNCSFSTNDDCIAIKSGKNPEGYYIKKPSENIQITYCEFIRGHGISIGSEISGGVRNVLVRNCKAGNLIYGLQIKGTKERGGFVEGVVVRDCDLRKITIFSKVSYNNDGEPAPMIPYFRDFQFSNLRMTGATPNETTIFIDGFEKETNYTRKLLFENIAVPEGAVIDIDHCDSITFKNVLTITGKKPLWKTGKTSRVYYQ